MLFFYEILGYPFICRLFFMIFKILDLFQLIPHKRLTFPSLTMLQHHMSKILTVHSLLCPIHLHFALFDLPSVTCNITVYSQHNSHSRTFGILLLIHIYITYCIQISRKGMYKTKALYCGVQRDTEGYTGSVQYMHS